MSLRARGHGPSPSAPEHLYNTTYSHPRLKNDTLLFPGPFIPMHPPPPGWIGKQPSYPSVVVEAVRAGMWHNRSPGEIRVQLDYSGVVSAYSEQYTSLVRSRKGLPRSGHRLGSISADDRTRLKAEAHSVLTRERQLPKVNWKTLFQSVLDRYADRLEDLRYILRRGNDNPVETVAAARQKLLIMISPYLVLPQANKHTVRSDQATLRKPGPDDDWFERIYQACASYATAGILERGHLTEQETMLAGSIDKVQAEICATLTNIWSTAFDSEERSAYAEKMVIEWRREVEKLMNWLDWHMWVKCDPPCETGVRPTFSESIDFIAHNEDRCCVSSRRGHGRFKRAKSRLYQAVGII